LDAVRQSKRFDNILFKENNENIGSLMEIYEIKGGNKNVISAKIIGQRS